jgi:hypothetical protein
MSNENSFVIEVPGGETERVIRLLRNKTGSLTARIVWQGRDRIEFSGPTASDLLLKVRLACPSATIEENGKITSMPEIGTWIEGRIIACPNKNCVTVQPKEPTKPKFKIVSWDPPTLQCFYCGRYINEEVIGQQLA